MLVAPAVLGVVAEHPGFTACFLGLAGLLLMVALLSGQVAPEGRGAAPAAAEWRRGLLARLRNATLSE